jgi:hypothetical protein
VFGSCFTRASFTWITRPKPELPPPQAFALSEELPANFGHFSPLRSKC